MTVGKIGAGRAITVALAVALALSLPGSAQAGEDESAATEAVPVDAIQVDVVAANGSGCPPGTVRAISNADRTGFRMTYASFVAEAGGTADLTDRRKNCQAALLVTVPAGWTFAIAEAEYRGRIRLDSGATALHRTNYYWQGSSENNTVDHPLSGPLSGIWRADDKAYTLVYQPCEEQRILNVNTELRVDEGTSSRRNTISMGSSEGDVDTLFNFAWRRC
ncbi:DUF4360 domain-containing protein [Phytohabitans sp. ZYX-F-186]|uniref:DUF4360 domain-containing protein n=1 Tax=Phytohabitans maris TaxID=3071409 RepID=A0ABU0ZXP8_9ACTN|nr:DUF4360 domain-containing protein [Phytohabitans sp. ZYX-F-186]MDQ7911282.1 DUF4360 domain-containing protein [Phytohabitans sp. ZYX-F-186]